MKIIGVITTKNRYEFFVQAVHSAAKQKRKPDVLIVVSDSDDLLKDRERTIAESCNAVFLENKFTSNYAGSLNTAIYHILEKSIFTPHDYENTYLAFLDDDDLWDEEYIAECEKALRGEDFVVSGLLYCNENGENRLSIPHKLDVNCFLRGNPHLQGSNTFVKLSVLLRAGLFDENMSSTIDRDIFTRIMLLKPRFAVVDKHLVKINAFDSRKRITNGREKKADGLRKFYYKYGRYMSAETESAFFTRAKKLFNIEKEDIKFLSVSKTQDDENSKTNKKTYSGNLVIGFIATDRELGLRLLKELAAMQRKNTKVVIFINFIESRQEYIDVLTNSSYSFVLIDREDVLRDVERDKFDQFVTEEKLYSPIIKDIAISRTILHRYLYCNSSEGDAIWILDEDMRLEELARRNGKLLRTQLEIDSVIGEYIGKYDAIVGNYTLDAPLPLLSTLRTSLLDYAYGKKGVQGESEITSFSDYYYDLSENTSWHLETPIRTAMGYTLDDIFCGKAQSRPLFLEDRNIKEATCRGGNTIVFNRELLTIPNWSIQIGDKIGRRSDYFWVWLAKNAGYKIVNAPFATMHDRPILKFNFEKEKEKLLLDLIGASFTKAVEKVGIDSKNEEFCRCYEQFFLSRMAKFVASFYRIGGLLFVIGDERYAEYFTVNALCAFLKEARGYLAEDKVACAYDNICRKLHMQQQMHDKEKIRKYIERSFSLKENSLRILGNGGEGAVFTDEMHVYKWFFKPLKNIKFLKRIARKFDDCDRYYQLEFFKIEGHDVIRYQYEKSMPYKGGYVGDFVEMLRFAEQNGFVYDNYKQDNFIVVQGKVKLVDYGKSFLPISHAGTEKSITRVYEMLRYPSLTGDEFKQLIRRSYKGTTQYLDDGRENLAKLISRRHKEDLHDKRVLEVIEEAEPRRILDYGAGKCKIANSLAKKYEVDVYDIDVDTLMSRADSTVKTITTHEELGCEQYDVVTCNLVLCCVSSDMAQDIVRDLNMVLKPGGEAIISICNPLFNSVQHTELRRSGLQGKYAQSEKFEKLITVGTPMREEYHRPIEYYINLFSRNGFRLVKVVEGEGVNVDTLLPISEHLVFVCEKTVNAASYDDCTLLIKTNPMEWGCIYKNIRHIVTALEKYGSFEKRLIVIDMTTAKRRVRRYAFDDEEKLTRELLRAKENGLIDEILCAGEGKEVARLYNKYFNICAKGGHASNGQGIFATLLAFERIETKYVFQTDSDILYYIDTDIVRNGIEELKRGAMTVTLGLARRFSEEKTYGMRTEVRTCLLDIEKLRARLPLQNCAVKGEVQLPWHRSLDLALRREESVRLADAKAWFVHPENHVKTEMNFVSTVEGRVEGGWFSPMQEGQVNMQGLRADWAEKTSADVVLYVRGYNTPCEKLKRLFNSIKKQTYQDFEIVYIDDASTNESGEYAKLILKYDTYFAERTKTAFNDENAGELANFVFAMQNMIVNKNAIVINVDNDDYLVNDKAVEIITEKFAEGAEITCGNCIRWDKPLKNYSVYSFDEVWNRDGDNVWLHPKCFRRYLFDYIDVENDLMVNGKYIDVNTDFAFMLPMIRKAKTKKFIEDILYYFEPSKSNAEHRGKYGVEEKRKIKQMLLDRARRREQ